VVEAVAYVLSHHREGEPIAVEAPVGPASLPAK
jgi:hypothetical protein